MVIVKRGDTNVTTWTTNMDLTGSTVRLLAKNIKTKAVTVLAANVADSHNGVVTHQLTGTLAVGEYYVELEITQNDTIVSAPTKGYEKLCVMRDLG